MLSESVSTRKSFKALTTSLQELFATNDSYPFENKLLRDNHIFLILHTELLKNIKVKIFFSSTILSHTDSQRYKVRKRVETKQSSKLSLKFNVFNSLLVAVA